MVQRLFSKVRPILNLRNANKVVFDWLTTEVYKTEPIKCEPESKVTILSQTFHRDVSMYLIAAKSFAHYVRPRRFIVVDDGLHDNDRSRIRHHLGEVEFIRSAEVDTGSCPRGACWERLVAISSACKDSFVVQLDADTVTTAMPKAVTRCIEQGRCFTLSTRQGRDFVSVKDASEFARGVRSQHVQIQAEAVLDTIPNAASRRYIRGCAGFAGFAQNSLRMSDIETFSRFMEEAIGRLAWYKWGSEQATSNYLVANTDRPVALSLDEYPYWSPGVDLTRAQLVHFIGEHRFTSTKYLRVARAAIARLPS